MKAFSKIEITIVLLLGIAVMLQFYINYIDISQPQSLLIMPISITFLVLLVWFFADNTNKKAFRKLSIILIFLIIIWFVFVQFMMALGKAFQH